MKSAIAYETFAHDRTSAADDSPSPRGRGQGEGGISPKSTTLNHSPLIFVRPRAQRAKPKSRRDDLIIAQGQDASVGLTLQASATLGKTTPKRSFSAARLELLLFAARAADWKLHALAPAINHQLLTIDLR